MESPPHQRMTKLKARSSQNEEFPKQKVMEERGEGLEPGKLGGLGFEQSL